MLSSPADIVAFDSTLPLLLGPTNNMLAESSFAASQYQALLNCDQYLQ